VRARHPRGVPHARRRRRRARRRAGRRRPPQDPGVTRAGSPVAARGGMSAMAAEHDPTTTALRSSHDELVVFAAGLDDDALTRQSSCTDWNVAQALSHLGTGAEIRLGDLEAVRSGREPAPRDAYQAIWDRWNALAPAAQRDAFVEWDTRQIE